MRCIHKNLVNALFPTNLDQFFHRDHHRRHQRDVINHSQPYSSSVGLPSHQSLPKHIHNLFIQIQQKRQQNFDDLAVGATDIGVNGLLDSTIGVVEHDDEVAFLESAFRECPSSLLKDDYGDGGGVINEGDFIEKLCFHHLGFGFSFSSTVTGPNKSFYFLFPFSHFTSRSFFNCKVHWFV